MTVKTGTAWAGTFLTQDATGALATPSTGPAGVLYVDGTANAAEVTITGTNPYKFAVTLPALTAGQRVDMYITATIDTIATAGVVASEQADTALTSEVKTETAAILADTGTDGVVIASAQTVATVTDVTNAVKISAGTGAGQLDFTSGVVKANLAQILGTALTETAGQIAAAFKKFFNVETPTGTVNSLPDAVAGANGGLPTTNGTKVTQTVDLTAGQSIAANGGTVATVTNLTNLPTMPNDWITAAGLKADAVTKLQANLALEATLTAIKGAGWSDQTLVAIDILIDAIKAKTDLIPATPAEVGSAMTLTAAYDKAKDDVLTPLATVDGIVDAIKAKTDNIPESPASANEYDVRMAAIQADLDNTAQYKADVSGIPEAVMLSIVEGVITLRDSLKLANAALAGKASGGGSGTVIFRDLADTLDRIIATVDEDNNRTVITRDLT